MSDDNVSLNVRLVMRRQARQIMQVLLIDLARDDFKEIVRELVPEVSFLGVKV